MLSARPVTVSARKLTSFSQTTRLPPNMETVWTLSRKRFMAAFDFADVGGEAVDDFAGKLVRHLRGQRVETLLPEPADEEVVGAADEGEFFVRRHEPATWPGTARRVHEKNRNDTPGPPVRLAAVFCPMVTPATDHSPAPWRRDLLWLALALRPPASSSCLGSYPLANPGRGPVCGDSARDDRAAATG